MNTFLRTPEFNAWLKGLKNPIGKARVIARIISAEKGNFGDCETVGDGISEMRIHTGAGYRVYLCRKGDFIYLLLGGGDKSSQQRDIKHVKTYLKTWMPHHE
jgi:putative addiction module killer protein